MASSEPKRRRLSRDTLRSLLHTGGVSIKGLAEILKKLQSAEQGDFALRSARNEIFAELALRFDLPLLDGSVFTWELVDPLKLLVRALEARSDLRALFGAAMRRSPPSAQRPWRLVLGFDAFTPGWI